MKAGIGSEMSDGRPKKNRRWRINPPRGDMCHDQISVILVEKLPVFGEQGVRIWMNY